MSEPLIKRDPVDQMIADRHPDIPQDSLLLIDPDCRDGKHRSCVGGPCECHCHDETETTEKEFDRIWDEGTPT